jgi:hypothetical protein
VYLILGKSGELQHDVSLEEADAQFQGKLQFDAVGAEIGNRGDVNGDGRDDILISAPSGNNPDNPGYAFLVLGRTSADWGNNFILRDQADASFVGEVAGHLAGQSVDIIGDLNGDGYDEFIIGEAKGSDEDDDRGKVYLFKGKPSGWQRNTPITQADAIFVGPDADGQAGICVRRVGDVNGDGVPDFAIGARGPLYGYTQYGRAYLIFGRSSINWGMNFSLSNADVVFIGENNNLRWGGYASSKIAPAGDVNGDGYDDFLINDYGDYFARGKAYVIFGKSAQAWSYSSLNLSQADASYVGEAQTDWAGFDIAGDFDWNSDGLSDFLVGSPLNSFNGDVNGLAYVIHGKTSGWSNNVNLVNNDGYRVGDPDDELGHSLSGIGDINGDGGADIAIAAIGNSDGGWADSRFGKIYVFLGEKVLETVEGTVKLLNESALSGVTINVNGTPQTTTNSLGEYSLLLQPGQDYTVVPYMASGQDVSSSVNSNDAYMAAWHVVRVSTLSSAQMQAADVDNDGAVTMNDAVKIARYSVGIMGAGNQIGTWTFDPASRVYNNIHQVYRNQDYTAMIAGDVDGSWGTVPMLSKSAGGVSDVWGVSTIRNDDELILRLNLKAGITLHSFDLMLEYDEKTFQFTGIEKDRMIDRFMVFSAAKEGILRVGGFSVESTENEGEFARLKFKKVERNEDFGEITLKQYQLNGKVAQESMLLYRMRGDELDDSCLNILKNYPNPFNSYTNLEFGVDREGPVRVIIYDQQGRTVKELLSKRLEPGLHRLAWDGKNDGDMQVASGVYFVSVTTSESMKNLKILLLQ